MELGDLPLQDRGRTNFERLASGNSYNGVDKPMIVPVLAIEDMEPLVGCMLVGRKLHLIAQLSLARAFLVHLPGLLKLCVTKGVAGRHAILRASVLR